MKRTLLYLIFSIFCMAPIRSSYAATEQIDKNELEVNVENGLMQRIDFGNSYIMGQKIQSGAVYLLQRKKSEIKSMLKPRENYREEILEDFTTSHKEMDSNGNNLR